MSPAAVHHPMLCAGNMPPGLISLLQRGLASAGVIMRNMAQSPQCIWPCVHVRELTGQQCTQALRCWHLPAPVAHNFRVGAASRRIVAPQIGRMSYHARSVYVCCSCLLPPNRSPVPSDPARSAFAFACLFSAQGFCGCMAGPDGLTCAVARRCAGRARSTVVDA